MSALARIRQARFFRLLPVQYLLPIAVLLAISFGSLFALVIQLTEAQDQMAREREIQLVRTSLESAKRLAEHDLRDYAMWDDAVVHLVLKFDQQWADNNIGPYLGREQQYDYVFVLDGADHPRYVYRANAFAPMRDPAGELGPAFAQALRDVRQTPGTQLPLMTGYSRTARGTVLYAVAPVTPLSEGIALPPGPTTVIGIARLVDGEFLRELAQDHHGPALRMTDRAPAGDLATTALKGPSGETLAYLSWRPAEPGSVLRREIWPAFIVAGLLSIVIAAVILRSGRRAMEALQFSETRAQHLANHDALTGLPNRRAMEERLQELLDDGEPIALLYLDLDGFKETNDVYGHGAGDELLRAVAARLMQLLPATASLARVGGDEFAIIHLDPSDAETLCAKILNAFSAVFSVAGFGVSLGVSIGVARNGAVRQASELVRRADAAMYAAKSRGKHCFEVYSDKIDAGRELRKQLEADLRSAIERGEIEVLYQPIVSAKTAQPVCVEALARWRHPQLGEVSPDRFIPIAEESGLIVALGRNVLRKACRESRDWNIGLAVNLSPAQFWDRGLANTIKQVLVETGFPPDRLELEITEGYLMRRPEAARDVLRELKSVGVRIALDDFGTGFASIGYLQQLGFDSIKIDRSFVAASADSAKAADLARAIVAIGDALDLPVTAEGVETREQARLMRGAGCARLQGWLFGKPMGSVEAAGSYTARLKLAG